MWIPGESVIPSDVPACEMILVTELRESIGYPGCIELEQEGKEEEGGIFPDGVD